MQFETYCPEQFRTYIHQLAATGEDLPALLGVSAGTLRRWLAGTQRVPLAAWRLVSILATGRLDTWHPDWRGWTIEAGHLVHGNTAYTAAQVESYQWWELQYRRNLDQLTMMQRMAVPLASEPGRLVNEARAALSAVVDAAETAHQVLSDCLAQADQAPAQVLPAR